MEFLVEEHSHLLNPLLSWGCYESKFLVFPDTWTSSSQAVCRHLRWSTQIIPSAWLHGLPEQLVMSRWNPSSPKFSKRVVSVTTEVPKARLDGAPSNVVWWKVPWPWQGSWSNITSSLLPTQTIPWFLASVTSPLSPSCLHEDKTHLRGVWSPHKC